MKSQLDFLRNYKLRNISEKVKKNFMISVQILL